MRYNIYIYLHIYTHMRVYVMLSFINIFSFYICIYRSICHLYVTIYTLAMCTVFHCLRYSIPFLSTLLHSTLLYSTLLYSTLLYSTLL